MSRARKHSRTRRRGPALALLLGFVLAQVAGWSHFALVAHERCPVDGLAAHGHDGHAHDHDHHANESGLAGHRHVERGGFDGGESRAEIPAGERPVELASEDASHHPEHCSLAHLTFERTGLPEAQLAACPWPTVQVGESGPRRERPRAGRALHWLAPKNSPPDATPRACA